MKLASAFMMFHVFSCHVLCCLNVLCIVWLLRVFDILSTMYPQAQIVLGVFQHVSARHLTAQSKSIEGIKQDEHHVFFMGL